MEFIRNSHLHANRMALGHLNTHVAHFLGVANNTSLVPRPPCPTGKRQSGTVDSNSWSKRETSFSLKKDVRCNKCPF